MGHVGTALQNIKGAVWPAPLKGQMTPVDHFFDVFVSLNDSLAGDVGRRS